jgi:antitoxin VapB
MAVARVRTFKSGNSEAVRLPKDIAFGDDVELIAVRSGDVLTLYPASMSIAEMVRRLAVMAAPPSIEKREDLESPERVGL